MDRDIAIYGAGFNPPGRHHREVVERLGRLYDEVIVAPWGPRPDKPMTSDVEPFHRAAMVDINFRDLPRCRVDLSDLEAGTFTRAYDLNQRFRAEGRPWHVVACSCVRGGQYDDSEIQRQWKRGWELWREARFVVFRRPGEDLDPADLPPIASVIEIDHEGTSLIIRSRVFHHQTIDHMVIPKVGAYIRRHGLYRGVAAPRQVRFRPDGLRCLIAADERNPESRKVASLIAPFVTDDPNLIVVIGGDGTMLRAIREHWRIRIPFYGINTGHLGFLLNDSREIDFLEQELVLYPMPLLWVEVESLEGEVKTALAFNDAWVERATGQAAWIRLSVNGREQIQQIVADGILVATAAGSTSYARAMGAMPLPLNTPALLLVGSNVLKPPHWKPAVLPLDSCVEVATLDPSKRPLQGFIDGVAQGEVRAMRTRVSNIAAVELAFLPMHDPAFKLAKIQFP
ncbi:MAG: NAD(+)/NADH kinase [Planctomycetaceae bacterium]|nr:NAD(+)/NADH kinase [Planctomycetaceae bacterium]